MTKILCVGLLLTLAGCGARSLVETEGETHWLTTCADGESCGGGQTCICGVCTQTCEESRDCRAVSRRGACVAIPETRYYDECQSEPSELSICVRGDDVVAPTSVDAGNDDPTEGTMAEVHSTSDTSEFAAPGPEPTTCDAGTCPPSTPIVMVAAGAAGCNDADSACKQDPVSFFHGSSCSPTKKAGKVSTCPLTATFAPYF